MRYVLAVLAVALACAGARAEPDKTGAAVAKVEAVADPAAEVARLEASVPPAKPEDVRSIDAMMIAIYESISGPAGNKDMTRFRSLMLPKGRLTESMVDEHGQTAIRQWSVDEFITDTQPIFTKQPFYETALVNKVQRYGNIAQVFSSYASHSAPDGKPFQRGINSMQLLYDGKRWWVLSILWDVERPGNALPKAMAAGAR